MPRPGAPIRVTRRGFRARSSEGPVSPWPRPWREDTVGSSFDLEVVRERAAPGDGSDQHLVGRHLGPGPQDAVADRGALADAASVPEDDRSREAHAGADLAILANVDRRGGGLPPPG